MSDQRITTSELQELGRRDADVLVGMMLPSINDTKGLLSHDFYNAATAVINHEILETLRFMLESGLRYGEIRKYHRALKRRFDERLAEAFAPFLDS